MMKHTGGVYTLLSYWPSVYRSWRVYRLKKQPEPTRRAGAPEKGSPTRADEACRRTRKKVAVGRPGAIWQPDNNSVDQWVTQTQNG